MSRSLALAALTALVSTAQAGNVLYVDDHALPGGDGTSWTNAYAFLQDALAAAAVDPGIGEIRIAQGLYRPDRSAAMPRGSEDRMASFELIANVPLVGGFAGLTPPPGGAPDDRDIAAFETILSGDLLGDDGPDFESTADNSFHVVRAIDLAGPAMLDGLTVESGNASEQVDDLADGGGLYAFEADVHVIECTFRDNRAADDGAAVSTGAGDMIAEHCLFQDNLADREGGAIHLVEARPCFIGCVFDGNVAGIAGGAVDCFGADPTFTDCLFTDNLAEGTCCPTVGGAVRCRQESDPTFIGCTFSGNSATGSGGAIDLLGGLVTMQGCLFQDNSCGGRGGACALLGPGEGVVAETDFLGNTAGSDGGAVFCTGGSPRFQSCLVEGNLAAGLGGGLYLLGQSEGAGLVGCQIAANQAAVGGGICIEDATIALEATVVHANHADVGGGIAMDGSAAGLDDCAITFNTGSFGAGLHAGDSSASSMGCLILANAALLDGGGVYSDGGDGHFTDCRFEMNAGRDGGGIHNVFGTLEVSECSILVNRADCGAGIYNRSGSVNLSASEVSGNIAQAAGGGAFNLDAAMAADRCLFYANQGNAAGGGAVYNDRTDAVLVSCTLDTNNVVTALFDGAALRNVDSSPALVNCTLWGNGSPGTEGTIFSEGDCSPVILNCILWDTVEPPILGGAPQVSFSIVEDGFPGPGNLDVDPMLDLGAYPSIGLLPGSPAIDAGDNAALPPGTALDLSGDPRFVDDPATPDSGAGDPPIVDMGAEEYQAGACPGDLDGDGVVGIQDLVEAIVGWPGDGSGVEVLLEIVAGWGPCPGGIRPDRS